MSSPKLKPFKKVHYEHGTKPGHQTQRRSSRDHDLDYAHDEHDLDSGFGSSSSNTASIGNSTPKRTSGLSSADISTQRRILSAVQEALDAANEKIRLLEASHARLDAALMESNKANRVLKREKKELEVEVQELREERRERREKQKEKEREKERERRTTPPAPPKSAMKPAPKKEAEYVRPPLERRMSSYRDQRPVMHQPPMNPNPNPFTPISERPPSASYQQSKGPYSPPIVSYSSGPVFPHPSPPSPHPSIPNDGRYHLTPI